MTTASEKEGWRNTILAGLANYIDSGSIVAGSVRADGAALALIADYAVAPRRDTVGGLQSVLLARFQTEWKTRCVAKNAAN